MAIQLTSLILNALQRAAAEPAGMALVGGRSAPGLFAATAAGKLAAQRCKDDGLLRVVRTQATGRKHLEVCTLTEKGLQHLLQQTSSRPVLEALLQAIERCEAKLRDLVSSSALQHQHLESLRNLAAKLLEQTSTASALPPMHHGNGQPKPDEQLTSILRSWHEAGQLGDCPLPELYRRITVSSPQCTPGMFHDVLRSLQEKRLIYLHPWTGPLYEMPEPTLALLAGHEIAYYASLCPHAVAA